MLESQPFLERAASAAGAPVEASTPAKLEIPTSIFPQGGLLCAVDGALVFVLDHLSTPGEVKVFYGASITSLAIEDSTLSATLHFDHAGEAVSLVDLDLSMVDVLVRAAGLHLSRRSSQADLVASGEAALAGGVIGASSFISTDSLVGDSHAGQQYGYGQSWISSASLVTGDTELPAATTSMEPTAQSESSYGYTSSWISSGAGLGDSAGYTPRESWVESKLEDLPELPAAAFQEVEPEAEPPRPPPSRQRSHEDSALRAAVADAAEAIEADPETARPDRVIVRWKSGDFEVSMDEFVTGIKRGRFGKGTQFKLAGTDGAFMWLGDNPLYRRFRPDQDDDTNPDIDFSEELGLGTHKAKTTWMRYVGAVGGAILGAGIGDGVIGLVIGGLFGYVAGRILGAIIRVR